MPYTCFPVSVCGKEGVAGSVVVWWLTVGQSRVARCRKRRQDKGVYRECVMNPFLRLTFSFQFIIVSFTLSEESR